jgi:hypothetical protein
MYEDQGAAGPLTAAAPPGQPMLAVRHHKHDRMVRTFIRALFTHGHILRPEQQARFGLLCLKTDVTIEQALEAFRGVDGQFIRGKTLVRDSHVESSYRVFLQGLNILAEYIARGLESAVSRVRDGRLDDDQDDGRRVRIWASSCWKLVSSLAATDRRWQVVTPSMVLRIVSAADALSDRAGQPLLTELGGHIDRRVLHRWLDFRLGHNPVA